MARVSLVHDLKTRGHHFYLKRFRKMETTTAKGRSKLEIFFIAVIGGAVMYYGAVGLVAAGLWGHEKFITTKRWAISSLLNWDLGNFEMSVDTENQVMINDRLPTESETKKLLYIALESAGNCQANLAEVSAITNLYLDGGKTVSEKHE